jgi:membrane protease YdiL (CAAX protease family)
MIIALGGLSTAFAGSVVARKSGKINSYKVLVKDFFCIKQPLVYYLIPVAFLFIIFGSRLLQGQLREGQNWLAIPRLFIIAILFGGVEEIGWRYVFQPALEKKVSFLTASVITTVFWSLWHVLYFVLDGTVFSMQINDIFGLFFGLLSASFILGCIYNVTKSLWLCVFYHALLNAFSQVFIAQTTFGTAVIIVFSIGLSVVLVRRNAC